jgi:hypothetical protein
MIAYTCRHNSRQEGKYLENGENHAARMEAAVERAEAAENNVHATRAEGTRCESPASQPDRNHLTERRDRGHDDP